MSSDDPLIELLLELQTLDRVPRMGFLLRGVADPESVAEHTFHVAILTWLVARQLPEIDTLRAVELALLHDLAEVRTGDLPLTAAAYWPPRAKRRAEAAAAEDLLAPLGERGRELWAEIASRGSAEARLAKACDKLQLMVKVTLYESWNEGRLDEFWDNEQNFPDDEFEPVVRLFEALRQKREALRRHRG